MPTNGFSIKPLKGILVAGEQKATEFPLSSGPLGLDLLNLGGSLHPRSLGVRRSKWGSLGSCRVLGGRSKSKRRLTT